jgi:hypothetical protein
MLLTTLETQIPLVCNEWLVDIVCNDIEVEPVRIVISVLIPNKGSEGTEYL